MAADMTLLEHLRARLHAIGNEALELTDEEIDALDLTHIQTLLEEFGARTLLRLPPRERAFMEWLRSEDPEVYADLWSDDDLHVSMYFLPALKNHERGYVICELETCDNYFFVNLHIKQEAKASLPGILERARKGMQLSTGEVLLFEILKDPIDIWHFCYKYGVPVAKAKATVAELVRHDWLVHLTSREDLAKYIEP